MDLCFMDWETKAFSWLAPNDPAGDVQKCGAYRYSENAFPTVLAYGINDSDIVALAVDRFDDVGLTFDHFPPELQAFHHCVVAGEARYVAWNAAFDRLIMSCIPGMPPVPLTGFYDAMAQAVTSNLPGKLDAASRALGRHGKYVGGKGLVGLFAPPNAPQPSTVPEQWDDFLDYAIQDVDEMREIWRATRPLTDFEWREYWANERINDRGFAIDLPFVRAAAGLAEYTRKVTNTRIEELTGGVVDRVTQAARIVAWIYDNCGSAEVRALLEKPYEADADEELEDDHDGEVQLSAKRDRMAAVAAFYEDAARHRELTQIEAAVAEVATLREYGGSASPFKFGKMLDMAATDPLSNGVALCGQYVFNGAPQSGRFSSRGVQIHNLTRKTVGNMDVEADAIACISEETT